MNRYIMYKLELRIYMFFPDGTDATGASKYVKTLLQPLPRGTEGKGLTPEFLTNKASIGWAKVLEHRLALVRVTLYAYYSAADIAKASRRALMEELNKILKGIFPPDLLIKTEKSAFVFYQIYDFSIGNQRYARWLKSYHANLARAKSGNPVGKITFTMPQSGA